MKVNKTISIELEDWLEFRKKTDNCSDTINNLVKSYCGVSEDITKNEIQTLKNEINQKIAIISKLTEEAEKKKKEDKPELKGTLSRWEKLEEAAKQLKANNWDYNKVKVG